MWASGFMGRLRFGALKATLLHKFINFFRRVCARCVSNLKAFFVGCLWTGDVLAAGSLFYYFAEAANQHL